MLDHQRFLNQDLVLKVNKSINPDVFDINKYEGFLDGLCGEREYQKTAIRNTLAYLLSGNYKSVTDLAEENYHNNETLQTFYGTFEQFRKHLQFPNKLSCSLDMATGTGKSYVIYGIARILLAEGAVDYVLVVCPSTTIEDGLMEKFKLLSGDDTLRNLSPDELVKPALSLTEGEIEWTDL